MRVRYVNGLPTYDRNYHRVLHQQIISTRESKIDITKNDVRTIVIHEYNVLAE